VSSEPLRRTRFQFPDQIAMAHFLRGLHTQEPGLNIAEAARASIGTCVVSVTRQASDKTERVETLAASLGGTPLRE